MVAMRNEDLKNRIAGALYGVAIGDALGAPLEFMSAQDIRQEHGYVKDMIGGGWLNVQPGEVTDDTQMTLAVAEGIAEQSADPVEAAGQRFIEWLRSGPKDIGGTCSRSITAAWNAAGDRPCRDVWFNASMCADRQIGGRSGGNGALMRTVYPGLYYQDLDAAETAAADIARMTHWAIESTLACILYTRVIYLITNGGNSEPVRNKLLNVVQGTPYDPRALTSKNLKPSVYVVDSFRCATASFWCSHDFEDALETAVNMGGDTDTIGAIAGGLAGAWHGFDKIPERWVLALDSTTRARLDAVTDAAVINHSQ